MTISEKLNEILKLAKEIQEEAAIIAAEAKTRPVARFYEESFKTGTTIGNIASTMSGFERFDIPRARQFEQRFSQGG